MVARIDYGGGLKEKMQIRIKDQTSNLNEIG